MRKGIGTLTVTIIFSVLMLILVITIFGYRAVPILGDISFDACWNEVKSYVADIVYRLEGPRLPIVEKERNRTVSMGDCANKLVLINHDDFEKDSQYRIFWEICKTEREGSYILGYPNFPKGIEDKKWWQLRTADLKSEISKLTSKKFQNINPICSSLKKPFSSNLNKKVLKAGVDYCLEFPERKGTTEEHDFKIKEGKC